MERHVRMALPSHSGGSMTVLWFPWRPGACKLTFGPGNSLQLVGEATRLPLSMRVGSTAGGQAQLLFQRQAPSAVRPEGGRKLGKSLQQGCRWSCRTSAPERWMRAGENPALLHAVSATIRFQCNPLDSSAQQSTLVILLFPSFYSKRGNVHSVCD